MKSAPVMTGKYQLHIYKGLKGFQKVAPEWQRLYNRAGGTHFFHSPQWYKSYLAILEADVNEIFIVAVFEQDYIRAIIPLKRHQVKIAGITATILKIPEHPHFTYRDILVDDQILATDLYELLCKNDEMKKRLSWDMLRIKGVYGSSYAMNLFAFAPFGRRFKKKVSVCSSLSLAPFDTMMKKVSKKKRKNWRNKRNKLLKQPVVRFQTVGETSQLDEAYRLFLDVERSGWKGRQGSAIALNSKAKQFYKTLYTTLGAMGSCEIHLLWINGTPAAAEFVLMGAQSAYTLKTGYNETYKKFSPGHFLLEYMMQHYYETHSNINRLNLMTGRTYLDYMLPEKESVYDLYFYGDTIKAEWLSIFVRLQYLLKDLFYLKIQPALLAFEPIAKFMDILAGKYPGMRRFFIPNE